MYGWSLEHIFEYVTIADVRELGKYAPERKRREKNDMYRNLINIIHIASYHPEKGSNKEVGKLFEQYQDSDQSYLNKPLDKAGLNMLARKVGENRKLMPAKRR